MTFIRQSILDCLILLKERVCYEKKRFDPNWSNFTVFPVFMDNFFKEKSWKYGDNNFGWKFNWKLLVIRK